MFGIYVKNTRGVKYADAIVKGYKTIETRNKNTLKSLVGKKVAIVKTSAKQKPIVIGYCLISSVFKCQKSEFDAYYLMHLVPNGSKYDCAENSFKYLYTLENAEICEPYFLPNDKINHGRAFVEF